MKFWIWCLGVSGMMFGASVAASGLSRLVVRLARTGAVAGVGVVALGVGAVAARRAR